MSINAKFIIKKGEYEQAVQEAAETRPILMPVEEAPAPVAPAPVGEPTGNHHEVVINGKTKTIAKSSAYLLDMITVEK